MPNRETLEENRRIHRKHVHVWKESGKSLNQHARENWSCKWRVFKFWAILETNFILRKVAAKIFPIYESVILFWVTISNLFCFRQSCLQDF